MQGDDLEVGSLRRIGDGEGTTLHIWRFGTGNLFLDNRSASGWHRPLRLGSSLLCCSALAIWELEIRLPTHTVSIFFHTYTSDSSLLLRNPESCPCGLWLASSLGNLAAIVVMDRAAKDIMILWDLGLPLMLLQVGNRRSR